MRMNVLLSVLSVTATLAAGAAVLPAVARPSSAAPANQAQGLTDAQIRDKLAAAGYSDIEAVERRQTRTKVYGIDKHGRQVELRLDARTGEVVKTEIKGDERAGERGSRTDGRRTAQPRN